MLTIFGQAVRQLRIERALLLKHMADALKLSSAQLSAIEVGRSALTRAVGRKTVEYFRPMLDADGVAKLEGVIEQVLALPDGGVGSGGHYGLPLAQRSPDELVAAFAGRLQGKKNREWK
jgi:transcriptional regulator with XRE-family HTH domain